MHVDLLVWFFMMSWHFATWDSNWTSDPQTYMLIMCSHESLSVVKLMHYYRAWIKLSFNRASAFFSRLIPFKSIFNAAVRTTDQMLKFNVTYFYFFNCYKNKILSMYPHVFYCHLPSQLQFFSEIQLCCSVILNKSKPYNVRFSGSKKT